jgi:hypothetical protein
MMPHDFTRFPEERGMIVFPISPTRISNSQSAKVYWEYVQELGRKIVRSEGIGVTFVYGDYLLFLTEQDLPATLRQRYLNLMVQHKNEFLEFVSKDTNWVRDYFQFHTYGQVRLDASKTYNKYLDKLFDIYKKDPDLQACVAHDIGNRQHTKEHASFVLEETLLFFLASKKIISYPNSIINHREKWVLHCYPGGPLATEYYLYSKNPFKLRTDESEKGNKYEDHFYDLTGRKLYDLSKATA